ncbi:hypothetical protein PPL_00679 [Heterostelium album PN500]|uniref:Uncharacterized protein n=1 Tax=Heterostelium pallidum (strain ATCC 26659 / Pp 5 / PN500) TaxID=670386 RepID=D3AX50_HETP5|nr:hypothetical protein PPL_00679 [Heterostelium album PN500]EFA86119.1 hypothetical protein PPL_00679 [Heterostelium album PN500]|eukprot:XP_020438224.1 hypothetical protein PPL_00679 [Heterostelium album PN500]
MIAACDAACYRLGFLLGLIMSAKNENRDSSIISTVLKDEKLLLFILSKVKDYRGYQRSLVPVNFTRKNKYDIKEKDHQEDVEMLDEEDQVDNEENEEEGKEKEVEEEDEDQPSSKKRKSEVLEEEQEQEQAEEEGGETNNDVQSSEEIFSKPVFPPKYKLDGHGYYYHPLSMIKSYNVQYLGYDEMVDAYQMVINGNLGVLLDKLKRGGNLTFSPVRNARQFIRVLSNQPELFDLLYTKFGHTFDQRGSITLDLCFEIGAHPAIINRVLASTTHYSHTKSVLKYRRLELLSSLHFNHMDSNDALAALLVAIEMGKSTLVDIAARYSNVVRSFSQDKEVLAKLLEIGDLDLLSWFHQEFSLNIHQDVLDKYRVSGGQSTVKPEEFKEKLKGIMNRPYVETNQRFMELEMAKYGNGGVAINEKEDMDAYMIRHYPFVLIQQESFYPENDSQLPIVQYLHKHMKETLLIPTLRYAIGNRLPAILAFLLENLTSRTASYKNCVKIALDCHHLDIFEQIVKFTIAEAKGEASKVKALAKYMLSAIRTKSLYPALKIYLKHFGPQLKFKDHIVPSKISYIVENQKAKEAGLDYDSIENYMDFFEVGGTGKISLVKLYLEYYEDEYDGNMIASSCHGAIKGRQLDFLMEIKKLLPDFVFEIDKRSEKSLNSYSTRECYNYYVKELKPKADLKQET